MNAKLEAAIKMLGEQGHTAKSYMHVGKEWFEIDSSMLATPQEMEELADGVYTLDELKELFHNRRAEEERVEMVTLSAVRRADGMLDYAKEGPGAFKSVLPPVFEKLEGQLKANNAHQDEIERFVKDLNRFGTAKISFPDRHHDFRA